MKFEAILRQLMDAAYQSYATHQKSEPVAKAIASALGTVKIRCDHVLGQVLFNPLILRDEGPIMTATIFHRDVGSNLTYGDIVAAGLIRLKSNHRVLAWRNNRLADHGEAGRNIFVAKFVEGDGQGGHRDVPPFVIGNLEETDQALRYLLSCWAVTGRQAEHSSAPVTELTDHHLLPLGQYSYPAALHDIGFRDAWPTDEVLMQGLLLGPNFISQKQVA